MRKKAWMTLSILIIVSMALAAAACGRNGDSDDLEDQVLLPFHEEGRFGYVNSEGEVIIEPTYEGFRDLEYGIVFDGDKMSPIFHSFGRLPAPNINLVRKDGQWGVINNREEVVIPFEYDQADFYDGEIIVLEKDQELFIFDQDGEVLHEGLSHREYMEFWEDRDPFQQAEVVPRAKDGKFGFVDRDGNTVIDHKFQWASGFSEGLAVATEVEGRQSGFGYIDMEGEYVIEPIYVEARVFHEGMAAVKDRQDQRFYYIDTDGEIVEGIQSDIGFSSINGIIRVVDFLEEKTRYVNREGEVIFEYEHLNPNIF